MKASIVFRVPLLAFAFIVVASCSDDTLPKYVELGGLRVLALRSDLATSGAGPAEFTPGDSVVVTPYVSDYRGGGRAISYSATVCLDPGVNYGATPSCNGVPGATTVAAGTVTLTGAVSSTGQADTFSVTIPATILSGRSSQDQYNGVNYLVIYRLTAGADTVTAFKRLVVTQSGKTKNQNPSLTSILANGSALGALPTGVVALSASYTAGSIESYTSMRSDGSTVAATEELVTTYFITDGTLKFYRTVNADTTTYTPPGAAPGDHSAIVVAITRDNRGGLSYRLHQLN